MKYDETIIDSEYQKLLPQFKPVFGNMNHVDLIKYIASLEKMEAELAKKVQASKGAETLRKEIYYKKRNIVGALQKAIDDGPTQSKEIS